MLIRKWEYEDIYKIAETEKKCFKDAWTFQMLADTFFGENTVTAAAVEGETLCGYGFLVSAGDEADIANIAVEPDFRRRGIAKSILENLIGKAEEMGVQRLFLEVRVSNFAAMLLYLHEGFVGKYVRAHYYADGEDAVVMVKELK